MRLRLSRLINGLTGRISDHASRFRRDRRGNIALTFGLVSVPLLLGVGVSIDYVRAYNIRTKMQTDLDAALIAAVKKVDSLDEGQLKTEVGKWFDAQTQDGQATYRLLLDTMQISKSNRTIQAVATGAVPTLFMGLANIRNVNVSVSTSVSGPSTSYLNVYLVFDKSPSMMLAATTSGQTQMKNYAESGCVFACHTAEGDSKPYNGVVYKTNYALAKAMGVQLRTDVAVSAAKEVLSLIDTADPTHSRIKVGLYKVGTTAKEVLAPTFSTSSAKTTLEDDSKGLNSATSDDATYLDTSLTELTKLVGSGGDGSTANSPLKLVLMMTDGMQSERNWVLYYNKPTRDLLSWNSNQSDTVKKRIWKVITPLNPDWCSNIKTAGATFGVLYTQYLPIDGDWGYDNTVGQTMSSSYFTTTWGGTIAAGVPTSTKRVDYIPYALKGCASKDMFISAADPDAIEQGLSTLFQQYLGSVRLTQ